MSATTEGSGPRYAPHDPSLPPFWRALVDGNTGYIYYWNTETNVTQYERPRPVPSVSAGPPAYPETSPTGSKAVASSNDTAKTVELQSPVHADDQPDSFYTNARTSSGRIVHGNLASSVIVSTGGKQETSHDGTCRSNIFPMQGVIHENSGGPLQVTVQGSEATLSHGVMHGNDHNGPSNDLVSGNSGKMPVAGPETSNRTGAEDAFGNNSVLSQGTVHGSSHLPHKGESHGTGHGRNFGSSHGSVQGNSGFSSEHVVRGSSRSSIIQGVMHENYGNSAYGGFSVNSDGPPQVAVHGGSGVSGHRALHGSSGDGGSHSKSGGQIRGLSSGTCQGNSDVTSSGLDHKSKRLPNYMGHSQQNHRGTNSGSQTISGGYVGHVHTIIAGRLPIPSDTAPGVRSNTSLKRSSSYKGEDQHKRQHVHGFTDILPVGDVTAYKRQHEISVVGDNVPDPFITFEATGFPSEILRELQAAGFSFPTPIQAQSWPIALQSRDIVAIAKTGSGKTLGYLLPGFLHMRRCRNNSKLGPTVLVLAPTRELATQIQNEAVKFGRSSRISSTCVYGGAPKGAQLRSLERGSDIVIATPGRLNDFLEMRKISLRQVTFLVLDEADRMLDMGFEPQIRKIVNEIPLQRQTLMYTATWPMEVRNIAADLLVNPVHINIGGSSDELTANKAITQHVEMVPPYEKQRRLEQILRSQAPGSKILIFCSTKKMCDQLARTLCRDFGAAVIHGDKSQSERDFVLAQFKSGRSPILIATDVAARGLDIKDIRVVINYDFPPAGVEDYVHRIGRTGRAGATGVSYTFFAEQDAKYAKELIKVLEGAGQKVPLELCDLAGRTFTKSRGGRWNTGNRRRRGDTNRYGAGLGDTRGVRSSWSQYRQDNSFTRYEEPEQLDRDAYCNRNINDVYQGQRNNYSHGYSRSLSRSRSRSADRLGDGHDQVLPFCGDGLQRSRSPYRVRSDHASLPYQSPVANKPRYDGLGRSSHGDCSPPMHGSPYHHQNMERNLHHLRSSSQIISHEERSTITKPVSSQQESQPDAFPPDKRDVLVEKDSSAEVLPLASPLVEGNALPNEQNVIQS